MPRSTRATFIGMRAAQIIGPAVVLLAMLLFLGAVAAWPAPMIVVAGAVGTGLVVYVLSVFRVASVNWRRRHGLSKPQPAEASNV